jgi:hypothetical protein
MMISMKLHHPSRQHRKEEKREENHGVHDPSPVFFCFSFLVLALDCRGAQEKKNWDVIDPVLSNRDSFFRCP